MMPFLNSVEIQAHALPIAAMTIRENAIDPSSSPTLFVPLHVFYLVWRPCDAGSSLSSSFCFFLGFSYVEIKSSAFQSQRVNKKITGSGPAICILNKVIAMPD